MRKIVLALAAFLWAPHTIAGDYREEVLFACKVQSELAEVIMQSRQHGITISRMVEQVKGDDVALALVLVAYKKPRLGTKEAIDREVQEFSSAAYLRCFDRATQ